MKPIPIDTKFEAVLSENQRVFINYIKHDKRFSDSVGQRFILIHIRDYGFDAFEQFWQKMRRAAIQGKDTVTLDGKEMRSLLGAIDDGFLARRRFLEAAGCATVAGVVGGLSLCLTGAGIQKKVEREDDKRPAPFSWQSLQNNAKELTEILPASVCAIISLAAFKIGWDSEKRHAARVQDMMSGERGEKTVQDLVASLDSAFSTVEIVGAESGVMQPSTLPGR